MSNDWSLFLTAHYFKKVDPKAIIDFSAGSYNLGKPRKCGHSSIDNWKGVAMSSSTSWGSDSNSDWGSSNLTPATFQHRLGALALDSALFVVTLGIGWIIWSLIVWGEGQTPGKKILKIRVYAVTTNRAATWGHMAVREFLFWTAVSIASTIFAPLGLAWIVLEIVWFFKDGKSRTLRDEWAKTLVVNEAA